MDKIQELKEIAREHNFCEGGLAGLLSCNNYEDLINCFFSNIDTCLALNFPTKRMFLKNFYDEAKAGNIFINENLTLKNPTRAALLGSCDATIEVDNYYVGTVYVKHNSKLHIKASGHVFIMVDALDNAVVTIESDNAKVTVNLYSKAGCTGNAKIINKNRETYDI